MKREELLKALFAELEGKAYNAEYHNYYYKEANQVIRAFFERTLPPAEGAEEILKKIECKEHIGGYWLYYEENVIEAMTEFATLHAQQMAEKMKDANQFILDIARVFGIETDGVGFDGLTLSIDDFKEAAEKMEEERLREELMKYTLDKWTSVVEYGRAVVDDYLKQCKS